MWIDAEIYLRCIDFRVSEDSRDIVNIEIVSDELSRERVSQLVPGEVEAQAATQPVDHGPHVALLQMLAIGCREQRRIISTVVVLRSDLQVSRDDALDRIVQRNDAVFASFPLDHLQVTIMYL